MIQMGLNAGVDDSFDVCACECVCVGRCVCCCYSFQLLKRQFPLDDPADNYSKPKTSRTVTVNIPPSARGGLSKVSHR